jgi:hypothetical protein
MPTDEWEARALLVLLLIQCDPITPPTVQWTMDMDMGQAWMGNDVHRLLLGWKYFKFA